ncbi:MAG: hypothetical protein O3A46_02855, partial [Candidatus Poribacteria bacterium]|nr:hypothetical protein [Candidatus Poribacteria bacterium]
VLQLVPVWAFRYFPSQDGPAHLNNATVLREFHHPDRTIYREYYHLNKNLDPNWMSHLLLAALGAFLPILIAEKLVLTGYVVLLPLSVRYALRAIRADAGLVAFLIFPFVPNYLYHMGFYNFMWSLPLYFFVFGYWLKHRERFGLRETVVMTFLALALYFCHLVSLVTVCLGIGFLAVWFTVFDLFGRRDSPASHPSSNRGRGRILWEGVKNRALIPLYALFPTFLLGVVFLNQKGAGRSDRLPFQYQWDRLRVLESLTSYDDREIALSTAVVWLFVAATVAWLVVKIVRRRWHRWDVFALVAVGYVVLYFISPDAMSGGSFISHRLMFYPFFALILWLGAQPVHRALQRTVQVAAIALTLGFLTLHTVRYAELNDYLDEYLSGMELIEPNTTVLPLCFSHVGIAPDGRQLARRIGLFLHASGYIAAERRVVELDNYEGNTSYFPVLFIWEVNPFAHLAIDGAIEAIPPRVDIDSYPRRSNGKGHVDYVLVWNMQERYRDNEDTQRIFRQLGESYDLIDTSKRGLMTLYRRKNWNGAADAAN